MNEIDVERFLNIYCGSKGVWQISHAIGSIFIESIMMATINDLNGLNAAEFSGEKIDILNQLVDRLVLPRVIEHTSPQLYNFKKSYPQLHPEARLMVYRKYFAKALMTYILKEVLTDNPILTI